MNELRRLPSVDVLIRALPPGEGYPHNLVTSAAREAIAGARRVVLAGGDAASLDDLVSDVVTRLEASFAPSLRRVINASGVLLQTNLGRAPLSEAALAAMAAVGGGYSNLEFSLDAGVRGGRHDHAGKLLREVTGAEDAIVVNNNAAGLFFVLSTFCAGQEVIVSRGQAVEIGGGFRIPDVLRQSGARLVEVGTTNRTYVRDYRDALSPETAALLRVHTSNFEVVGFTASPALEELAAAAKEAGVLLIDDLGSGCVVDTTRFGMRREPTVRDSIEGGADLVLFSGDKLLGGPQCGVIAGGAEQIGELKRHPLARALRVDKTTIAALEATLLAYLRGAEAEEIPIWRMLSQSMDALQARATAWAASAGGYATVVRSRTMVGGGSLPGEGVETCCAAVRPASGNESHLARSLRQWSPPIVARIEAGSVLLDPRTVEPADDGIVSRALAATVEIRL